MEGLKFFLVVSQILISLALIISILIQQSDGDSLSGIGGGGANNSNSAISGRAATSLMSKISFGLVFAFFFNSLLLGSIAKINNNKLQKELEKVVEEQNASKPSKPQSQAKSEEENSAKNNSKETSKDASKKTNSQPTKSKAPIIPSVE